MKLIIPGLGRTGTKSLWKFFGKYPEVASSKLKEPIRINKVLDNYLENFNITDQTKMLFDGTPELTNSYLIHDLLLHPDIDVIYQIWFDRNPLDRIKSLKGKYKRMPKYKKISDEIQEIPVDDGVSLERAKSILGHQNIFISKIDEPNVERKIEHFLGLGETNISLPWEKH